jgi:glycosyltransferase involved in cell wall biosynthesis
MAKALRQAAATSTPPLALPLSALEPLRGKVAILVPTYNNGSTLAETLQSLMDQGEVLDLFRCVVVADDGSRDECAEIARRTWKSKTPIDIRVAPKNRGEATNVTEGALGMPPEVEWFFLIHSDNVAKEGWLQTVMSHILTAGSRVASVSTSWDVWIPNVRTDAGEDKPQGPIVRVEGRRETVRDTLFQGCWWHHSTAAIRVSALRSVGGYRTGLRQMTDWDLLIRLMTAGWEIHYVPRSLIKYREHEGGVSFGNFLRHRDIWEGLVIGARHQWALTFRELVRFHAVRSFTLFRRMASSLLRGEWRRLYYAALLEAQVPFFFAKCVWERLLGRARPPKP